MYTIDELMDMLDWNKPEKEQQKGIELAREIKSINVFLQPLHPGANKNVWGNCATILAARTDEELAPYMRELLEWLEDINWPGALDILERLQKVSDVHWLCFSLISCAKEACACNKICWLGGMSNLIKNKKLKEALPKDIVETLEKYYITL